MIRIASFLFLVATICQINAEVKWDINPPGSESADDGMCEIYGRRVKYHEFVPVPPSIGCYQQACYPGGLTATPCSPMRLPSGSPCKIVEDNTKPYPGCCQRAVCPGDPGF